MSMGQLLASGAAAVFSPSMFLMVCVAIVLVTVFGALPGVSATMAVALGLTFTYTMQPIPEWEAIYRKVKKEAIELGIPMDPY